MTYARNVSLYRGVHECFGSPSASGSQGAAPCASAAVVHIAILCMVVDCACLTSCKENPISELPATGFWPTPCKRACGVLLYLSVVVCSSGAWVCVAGAIACVVSGGVVLVQGLIYGAVAHGNGRASRACLTAFYELLSCRISPPH